MKNNRGKTSKEICLFVKKPFDDCYCVKLTSIDADAVLRYCQGSYKTCKIYVKNMVNTGYH
jgi:hypothetical protein